eukprot:4408235-Alexandrium_andersonii.AAC.1
MFIASRSRAKRVMHTVEMSRLAFAGSEAVQISCGGGRRCWPSPSRSGESPISPHRACSGAAHVRAPLLLPPCLGP